MARGQQGWGASHIAQLVNHLPAMQETQVQFLDWEDPMEKGMCTAPGTSRHLDRLSQEAPVRFLGWEDPLEKGRNFIFF